MPAIEKYVQADEELDGKFYFDENGTKKIIK